MSILVLCWIHVLTTFAPEHQVSIDVAYTLGRLMLRSKGPSDRQSGRRIVIFASQSGSARASLYIVKTALKQNQLSAAEIKESLKHVNAMAKMDPPSIPALVLEAQIHEARDEHDAALETYLKAINSHTTRPWYQKIKSFFPRVFSTSGSTLIKAKVNVDEDDTELDIAAAHLNLGNLQADYFGDYKRTANGAIAQWEKAALQYDDPNAYYRLAQLIEDSVKLENRTALNTPNLDSSEPLTPDIYDYKWISYAPYEWYEYSLKAAASGHPGGMCNMGRFYMIPYLIGSDRLISFDAKVGPEIGPDAPLFTNKLGSKLDSKGVDNMAAVSQTWLFSALHLG